MSPAMSPIMIAPHRWTLLQLAQMATYVVKAKLIIFFFLLINEFSSTIPAKQPFIECSRLQRFWINLTDSKLPRPPQDPLKIVVAAALATNSPSPGWEMWNWLPALKPKKANSSR